MLVIASGSIREQWLIDWLIPFSHSVQSDAVVEAEEVAVAVGEAEAEAEAAVQ